MTLAVDLLFYAAAGCIVASILVGTLVLAASDGTEISDYGDRGYQRQVARRSPLFSFIEPLLSLMASWIAYLPLGSLRASITTLLRQAGNYRGLSSDEFMVLSLLTSGACMFVAGSIFSTALLLIVGALSAGIPYLVVSAARDARAVAVTRALPNRIELVALCVSAGMDFPGALREVIGDHPEDDDPLNNELRQFLRDLDLGHSRRQALLAFGARVSGDGVGDLVAALVQSEEMGTPLRAVLTAQAKVLQARRSFRAEELAKQAEVKMAIPLTILMFMVLIIIIAPLMITLRANGF